MQSTTTTNPPPKSTRLDNLIHILQNGKSLKLRKAAGDQIAHLATASKPYNYTLIQSLIKRLYPLLHATKDASTRVAFTHTFDCLATLLAWDPLLDAVDPPQSSTTSIAHCPWTDAPIVFKSLNLLELVDLPSLLANHHHLTEDPVLAAERKSALAKLGLNLDDLVQFDHQNEQQQKHTSSPTATSSSALQQAETSSPTLPNSTFITNGLAQINDPATSTRERNSIRRRLKRLGVKLPPIEPLHIIKKQRRVSQAFVHVSNLEGEEDLDDESGGANVNELELADNKLVIAFKKKPSPPPPVPELENHHDDPSLAETQWPFQALCDMLCIDILNPVWEVRQGAAMTLRDILKSHGGLAGKIGMTSDADNHQRNQAYLMHIAIRIIQVLCRDNFADYKGDIVTVPVRETASQVLGALAKYLDAPYVIDLLECILNLAQLKTPCTASATPSPATTPPSTPKRRIVSKDWSMHLSAFLAIKYILAIRQGDMSETLLHLAFPVVMQGLAHSEDDVRAVAAEMLVPVTDTLVRVMSVRHMTNLVVHLATCLDACDDLSSSTGAVMDLLTALIGSKSVQLILCPEHADTESVVPLHTFPPRLYKLIRHPATTVRHAVLRTLRALVAVEQTRYPAQDRFWIRQDLVRYVFQNFLLESASMQIVDDSLLLLQDVVQYLVPIGALSIVFNSLLIAMLQLAFTPIGRPLDASLLLFPSQVVHRSIDPGGLDRAMALQELQIVSVENVVHGRLQAVRALGYALGYWHGDPKIEAVRELQVYLHNPWAWQRQMSALVVAEYAYTYQHVCLKRTPDDSSSTGGLDLSALVLEISNAVMDNKMQVKLEPGTGSKQQVQYMEIRPTLNHLYTELVATARDLGLGPVPTIDKFDPLSIPPSYVSANTGLQSSLNEYVAMNALLQARVLASGAVALIAMNKLPNKVTPIVRALTDVLKLDDNLEFQKVAANAIGDLAFLCDGKPVVDKLVVNLSVLVCSDPETTPLVSEYSQLDGILTLFKENLGSGSKQLPGVPTSPTGKHHIKEWIGGGSKSAGIHSTSTSVVSPTSMSSTVPVNARKRKQDHQSGLSKSTDPRSMSAATTTPKIDPTVAAAMASSVTPATFNANRITYRGAGLAIHALSQKFGANLLLKVPKLMSIVSSGIHIANSNESISVEQMQSIVDAIQLFVSLAPAVHTSLFETINGFTISSMIPLLDSPSPAIRYMVSLAVSAVASVMTGKMMPSVIGLVLPKLQLTLVNVRRGAIECVYHLTTQLGVQLLPYVIFLVVPIIGVMSDYNPDIRQLASRVFGMMIQLVPLEEGYSDPSDFPAELSVQKVDQRRFLSQLLGSEKPDPFLIPIDIRAELRPYQLDGVNWMMFLNKYQLHGALCDDMGLGKTLQTITVISSHHAIHPSDRPSIVVCPLTLMGHWADEIIKYSPNLSPILLAGPPSERRYIHAKIKNSLPKNSVVVTSYETVRNDYEVLSTVQFEYCCLDEGHMIRNPKTKVTQAVKTIQSRFRLLLSGTPIQNNVTELWSLFDFLMPGFLGTEQQFNGRYGNIIRGSRDASKDSEIEAGEKALKELHRQVLPFILRRMKEDVLDDLPPKIIQDHYCEMSPLQIKFYREIAQNTDPSTKVHVFQALRSFRNICNHPVLYIEAMRAAESRRALQDGNKDDVMDNKNGDESTPKSNLALAYDPSDPVLRALQNAPKLLALKQLLEDSGIGLSYHGGHQDGSMRSSGFNAARSSTSMTNQDDVQFIMDVDSKPDSRHRVLVFAQLKSMLDIIEMDLFRTHMPSVSYLRLDGSVDPRSRQVIVNKFNDDPSIDVLLLTTGAGGLGLNLTGADKVIFVDHDWNPMRDLQAMDRAHRLGQKRVVNVYRLITRGTIEEKIMGLQRFKIHIAGQVVNQQNTTMDSMDTDQLLDLFNVNPTASTSNPQRESPESTKHHHFHQQSESTSVTAQAIMSGLDELIQGGGYEDEDNMSGFLASI